MLKPPLEPMEAELVREIPRGKLWQYEPKWDGFRCLAFRDGPAVELWSKSGQPLTRYFPELAEVLAGLRAKKYVIDGEIVIPRGDRLSFDDLLQRIHPAASRIKRLSTETPAMLIVFDLLADERGKSLLDQPLAERRARLEKFAKQYLSPPEQVRLSPATTSFAKARRWFESSGASTDGIMAKRLDLAYRPGERTAMVKIKPIRTADCVIGGFRYAEKKRQVGSLLLGLYDDEGLLHHVGFCSGIKAAERASLTAELEKLIEPPGFTGRAPGGPSRWSTERSTQWQPLRPVLVVEVDYDQFTSGRFRHGTRLRRWRPDKAPRQCTLDQIRQGGTSLRLLASPRAARVKKSSRSAKGATRGA